MIWLCFEHLSRPENSRSPRGQGVKYSWGPRHSAMLSGQCIGQSQHKGPQHSVLGWRVGSLGRGQWPIDKYTEIGDLNPPGSDRTTNNTFHFLL